MNGRGEGGRGRRRLSLALAVPLHPRRPSPTSSLSSSSSGGGLVGCLSSVTSAVVVRRRAWEGEVGVREGIVVVRPPRPRVAVGRQARKEVEVGEGVRVRV